MEHTNLYEIQVEWSKQLFSYPGGPCCPQAINIFTAAK